MFCGVGELIGRLEWFPVRPFSAREGVVHVDGTWRRKQLHGWQGVHTDPGPPVISSGTTGTVGSPRATMSDLTRWDIGSPAEGVHLTGPLWTVATSWKAGPTRARLAEFTPLL